MDRSLRVLQIHPFLRGEPILSMERDSARIPLMLTRGLLEAGHTVALFPWPERLWGKPAKYEVTKSLVSRVHATLALPDRRDVFSGGFRWMRSICATGMHASTISRVLYFSGFRNAVREFKPDVIHVHRTSSDIPLYHRLADCSAPMILTQYYGKNNIDGWAQYRRIVFPSRTGMQEAGFDPDRMSEGCARVLYNPVECECDKNEPGPADERGGILCVAGSISSRALNILIESVSSCRDVLGEDVRILLAAKVEDAAGGRRAEPGIRVSCEGEAGLARVGGLLAHARILIFLDRRPMRRTIIQLALARGVPVIARDAFALELLSEMGALEMTALPTGPLDRESLINALRSTRLRNAESVGRQWDSAQQFREQFSVARYSASMGTLYREVCGDKG